MRNSHQRQADSEQSREHLAQNLESDALASVLERDELSSARTFFQAGRGSFDRGDMQNARLYFGLAAKLFSRSAESVNAHIAREWYQVAREHRGPAL